MYNNDGTKKIDLEIEYAIKEEEEANNWYYEQIEKYKKGEIEELPF